MFNSIQGSDSLPIVHKYAISNCQFKISISKAFYKNESLLKLYHKISDPEIIPQTILPAKLATFSEAEDKANAIW